MIYVASSWRNQFQPTVIKLLREAGVACYDFREPEPGIKGFDWSQIDPIIDPVWQLWIPNEWFESLKHPLAVQGFQRDMVALDECKACLLVLPCGRSAHLELGYCVGAGKPNAVLALEMTEADLMVAMCDELFDNMNKAVEWCKKMAG